MEETVDRLSGRDSTPHGFLNVEPGKTGDGAAQVSQRRPREISPVNGIEHANARSVKARLVKARP